MAQVRAYKETRKWHLAQGMRAGVRGRRYAPTGRKGEGRLRCGLKRGVGEEGRRRVNTSAGDAGEGEGMYQGELSEESQV